MVRDGKGNKSFKSSSNGYKMVEKKRQDNLPLFLGFIDIIGLVA
jgi:hypothetical protein